MIKIFGIGNSFTEDAHTWLKQISKADGIDVKLVTPFNLEKPEYITLMPPENLGDGFFIAVMERS